MEIGPEPDSTPATGSDQLTLSDPCITLRSPIAESTGLPILSGGWPAVVMFGLACDPPGPLGCLSGGEDSRRGPGPMGWSW